MNQNRDTPQLLDRDKGLKHTMMSFNRDTDKKSERDEAAETVDIKEHDWEATK